MIENRPSNDSFVNEVGKVSQDLPQTAVAVVPQARGGICIRLIDLANPSNLHILKEADVQALEEVREKIEELSWGDRLVFLYQKSASDGQREWVPLP